MNAHLYLLHFFLNFQTYRKTNCAQKVIAVDASVKNENPVAV